MDVLECACEIETKGEHLYHQMAERSPAPIFKKEVMMDLSNLTCKPPKSGDTPFTNEQARKMIKEVPNWILKDASITREFLFKDFLEAMGFVNKVAEAAEGEQHHPGILIMYKKVKLTLTTEKIGGLSQNDFIMAAKIDLLLTKPSFRE